MGTAHKFRFWLPVTVFSVFLTQVTLPGSHANPVYFVREGSLVRYDPQAEPGRTEPAGQVLPVAKPVYEFLGLTSRGRPVVSLGTPFLLDGMVTEQGLEIAILSSDGTPEKIIHENAVRAYPAPVGDAIAVITLDYSLALYRDGRVENVSFPGRVVLAAWSPDATRLCLTAYPPDWSPKRVHNPSGPDEFFRLINNDLYLLELSSGQIIQLTQEPGYDYGGVFSPDGQQILFISDRSERGAFYIYDLPSRTTTQITNRAAGSYEIPIGRSDSIHWSAGPAGIVYEAQESSEVDTIRSLKPDGSDPRRLGYGRQPRIIEGGKAVVYLSPEGRIQSAKIE